MNNNPADQRTKYKEPVAENDTPRALTPTKKQVYPEAFMLSYDAIIFDMDGVIIDSEPLHEKAQRIVFNQYQLTVPSTVFSAFKGKTEADVFGHVVETYADNRVDASELIALKHDVYSDLMGELQLIDGARPLIERLVERGISLGLTTSATRRDQQRTFALFDLAPYFNVVVTAEDVTNPKPDPEPYLTTARRLAVAPASCLVIEDSTHGVMAAQQAGCTVIGLSTSFSAERLLQAGARLAVDGYDELARHLISEEL